MAFLLSVAMGGSSAWLLENIRRKVRGVSALTAITRLQPLVVIPEIHTEEELRVTRQKLRHGLLALAGGFLLLLVLVHLFVMPLNELAVRVMHYSTVPTKGTYGKY